MFRRKRSQRPRPERSLPERSLLEDSADQAADDGDWPEAIALARMALDAYEIEAKLAADRSGYASLVAAAEDRLERFLAEATKLGAPTQMPPSASARALIAAAKPVLTRDDQAIIAQARGEAAAIGVGEGFEHTLAQVAAALGAELPDRDDRAEAPWLTAEFDRSIRRLRTARTQEIHPTVDHLIARTAAAPADTGLQIARKLARQAVLLDLLGRQDRALTAAGRGMALFVDAAPLDATDEGYFAYVSLPVAQAHLEHDNPEGACRVGMYALKLFSRHEDELIPAALPDLVWAAVLVADAEQRRGGDVELARQAAVYAATTAKRYDRLPPASIGAAESIPEAPWGLPFVRTEAEWVNLTTWLHNVARRIVAAP
jgi:hypothetical protein